MAAKRLEAAHRLTFSPDLDLPTETPDPSICGTSYNWSSARIYGVQILSSFGKKHYVNMVNPHFRLVTVLYDYCGLRLCVPLNTGEFTSEPNAEQRDVPEGPSQKQYRPCYMVIIPQARFVRTRDIPLNCQELEFECGQDFPPTVYYVEGSEDPPVLLPLPEGDILGNSIAALLRNGETPARITCNSPDPHFLIGIREFRDFNRYVIENHGYILE